jgi:hypothetical protein
MTQLPPDESTSPLGEILEDLPQEKPPAGLKDRCLRAVHAEEATLRPKRVSFWPILMRTAGAVAGVFLVLLVVASLPMAKRAEAPPAGYAGPSAAMPTEAGKPGPVPGERDIMEGTPPRAMARKAAPAAGGRLRSALSPAPSAAPWPPPPSTVDELEERYPPAGGGAVERPWRDMSGERQKRTRKEMELQVRDVQDAYDRATSIIRKEGGYVDTEDLRIENHGPRRAHLEARVPVQNLAGTLAQLRELGKVVKLVGESEDVTDEYYGRGEEIRGMGAREEELVAQYEQEKNPARKRELYRQIMALREQNKQHKQPLRQLSKETHFALLDLTLVEPGGPGRFLANLGQNAGTAAGWLGVSGIFWLPVLVIAVLVWRRRASS